jgi:subtilisin family serine protease
VSGGRAVARAVAVLALVVAAGCATPRRPATTGSEDLADSPLVLVTLRPGEEARESAIEDQLLRLYGLRLSASWHMRSLGEQCLVMVVPRWLSADRAAAEVRSHPAVSGAVAVHRYEMLGDAPDPYARLQLESFELPLDELHAAATGRGVTVAVVDTGLDFTHPDLAGRVSRAVDFVGRPRHRFDSDHHGTAVAGVIAAVGGNGIGGVGVAPDARIWALRACWHEPSNGPSAVCDSYTLAQALDLVAAEVPQVLNLSLAGEPDELIERLVTAALERGVVVVGAVAAGAPSFPASVRGVIAVRSAERVRAREPEAARAGGGALAAPGVDLLTTVPGGGFDFVTGASFAAAWTSGVVALLLERQPAIVPGTVAELLTATASGSEVERRVDPCAALARLTERAVCAPPGLEPGPARLAATDEPAAP